jgi:hypothetical protein
MRQPNATQYAIKGESLLLFNRLQFSVPVFYGRKPNANLLNEQVALYENDKESPAHKTIPVRKPTGEGVTVLDT